MSANYSPGAPVCNLDPPTGPTNATSAIRVGIATILSRLERIEAEAKDLAFLLPASREPATFHPSCFREMISAEPHGDDT